MHGKSVWRAQTAGHDPGEDVPRYFSRVSMIIIRCSSSDRVLACASSLATTDTPYNPNSQDANEGRALHEAIACTVSGIDPDLDHIAAKYSIDRDTLGWLHYRASEAWATIRYEAQTWRAEQRLEAMLSPTVKLQGTTDVVGYGDDGPIIVVDWKAGHQPSTHTGQLRSYAYLASDAMGARGAKGIEVWLRAGEMRIHEWTHTDLEEHAKAMLAQTNEIGKQYGPGSVSCRYCHHQQHCIARREWVQGAVMAMQPSGGVVTRETLGALYGQSKQLAHLLRQYDEALEAELANGPIALPDGSLLSLEEVPTTEIRPSRAMSFIREVLKATPQEADEILSVSKTGLERVVKARSQPRQGAKDWRAAMEKLTAAGAVETTTRMQKKTTPPQPKKIKEKGT